MHQLFAYHQEKHQHHLSSRPAAHMLGTPATASLAHRPVAAHHWCRQNRQGHTRRLLVSAQSADQGTAACSSSTTISIPSGQLTIQPLSERDVQGAALLLTRAFAGTAEAVKLDEAMKYMQERLQRAEAGTGLTVVARLAPTDPALLPPGKDSRLVGTVSLSFGAASREDFDTLAPPEDEPYLANMAVDPKFRRQGVARAMLAACDETALHTGQRCIWLHVRQSDAAAQALYAGYAYREEGRDKPAVGFFGVSGGRSRSRPRILLRRQLGETD